MGRAFRAELLKLRRRSMVLAAGCAALLYAAITALVTFLPAKSGPLVVGPRGIGATLESLAQPGGATQAFADGIGFLGVILLAIFISSVGFEYSRGTFATALMKEPRRLRLLGGKIAALLVFLGSALLVAEAAGWLFAFGIAPLRGISTSAWFSASALGDAAAAYGTALFVAAAWACIGVAVAVLTRSVPIALAIGIAWAGPAEHLTQRAWAGASSWFPGLLLEASAAGGNAEVPFGRALAMAAVYAGVLMTAALVAFSRRDVTT
jgi:ABC-2 type transport system permease protein